MTTFSLHLELSVSVRKRLCDLEPYRYQVRVDREGYINDCDVIGQPDFPIGFSMLSVVQLDPRECFNSCWIEQQRFKNNHQSQTSARNHAVRLPPAAKAAEWVEFLY